MSREAHKQTLKQSLAGTLTPDKVEIECPDFDRLFADQAEPLILRLARERNTLVTSMSLSDGSEPVSPIRRLLVNSGAKRRKQAHIIKVRS